MPVTGTPTKLLWQIEDDTAVILNGRDAAINLELFVRAQARRGYIDAETMAAIEQDLDAIHRAIRHKLDYTRHLRANPEQAK